MDQTKNILLATELLARQSYICKDQNPCVNVLFGHFSQKNNKRPEMLLWKGLTQSLLSPGFGVVRSQTACSSL